jgi:hypothetical protein
MTAIDRALSQARPSSEEIAGMPARPTREIEALYRADEHLYRHLHLQEVLQALVDAAVDILQADKSGVMVWDEQRQRIEIRAARGFSAESIAQMRRRPLSRDVPDRGDRRPGRTCLVHGRRRGSNAAHTGHDRVAALARQRILSTRHRQVSEISGICRRHDAPPGIRRAPPGWC